MPSDPWVPQPLRIARATPETADTFTFRFDAPAPACPFAPGQFNMLYLFGVGEVAISISGDSDAPGALVHTIRAVGTVTTAMKRLRRGDTLGVRGPYGTGWPLGEVSGKDLLIIAGGLGIAPLRPVVYHAIRHPARLRKVTLLYGARSPADLLYRSELAQWAKRLDVRVTVDHADPDWRGDVGVVPALLDEVTFDPASTVAMLCGPEVMMRFTSRALARRGLRADRVYLSMERNMKCALGFCGHCQYRESFICKDGPVLRLDRIESLLYQREI